MRVPTHPGTGVEGALVTDRVKACEELRQCGEKVIPFFRQQV
jgi:hypothetical protein